MSFENYCRPEPSFPLLDFPTTRLCFRYSTRNQCTVFHHTSCLTTDTSLCQCRWLLNSTPNRTDFTVKQCKPRLRLSRTYHQQRSPRRSHAETSPIASTALRVFSCIPEHRLSTLQAEDPLDRDLSRDTRGIRGSSLCLTSIPRSRPTATDFNLLKDRINLLNHLRHLTLHLYPSQDPRTTLPLSTTNPRISLSPLSTNFPRPQHHSFHTV
jgi:hypothetical protein